MTQKIKLPPLPRGYTDGSALAYGDVYDDGHMQAYARAAIEADRQASGEPVAWKELALESIKRMRAGHVGCQDILMKAESLLGSEKATQPQQPASEPDEMVSIGGTLQPLPRWLIEAADRIVLYMKQHNHEEWAVGGIQSRNYAPQPQQIPEGYKLCLIPKEGTPAFNAACSMAYQESKCGTGPCGVFIAGLRAMLEAAPEPSRAPVNNKEVCGEQNVIHAPQPQQQVSEPITEAIKRITDFIERRKQIRGIDQAEIMALDGCEYALLTEDLLAVCAAATQPQQIPEGFCLDAGHRGHKARTGEECTCPKYVRHPECDRHEIREHLPAVNPWKAAPEPRGDV